MTKAIRADMARNKQTNKYNEINKYNIWLNDWLIDWFFFYIYLLPFIFLVIFIYFYRILFIIELIKII